MNWQLHIDAIAHKAASRLHFLRTLKKSGLKSHHLLHLLATVCKTVCPVLSDRLSVLSVCNVGVLWPNGFMHQDETWHAGRLQPWPHCVRWGPSSQRGTTPPNFRPISIVAKWLHGSRCHLVWRWPNGIKMEVGLSPGDIVLA